MKKRRIIVLILVLAAAGAGGWYYLHEHQKPTDVIRVSGNIEVTDVALSFRLPGWVWSRPADEGMEVRPGDVVALLDETELRHQVEQNRAELGTAQAALAALQSGSRPEEIAQAQALLQKAQWVLDELLAGSRPEEITAARATVKAAQADADRTALDFARLTELHEKGITSKQEYDNARTAADAATAHLHETQSRLKLAEEGPRKEQIEQARAALQDAQQHAALVKAGPRIEDIQQGQARVEQLKQAMALTQVRLGFCTLRSPVGGIVLSKNTEAGEFVAAGTPIITIGDLKDIWLRAYVDEPDMTRVHLGQRVKVYTDSPDKPYEGYISFIAPQAEFTPKNVQTQKERVKLVFRVKIQIPNPDLKLKPGVPADADILFNEISPLAPKEILAPQKVPATQPTNSSSATSSSSQ